MQLSTYLSFNGKCEEAFNFYEKTLKGKITFKMTWGESPEAKKMPAESQNKIMHISLSIDNAVLQGADAPPNYYTQPAGICVSISLKDKAEGERIFKALSENGKVQMPFGKTFWSPGFGMCIDRFGIPWMVNCEGAQT